MTKKSWLAALIIALIPVTFGTRVTLPAFHRPAFHAAPNTCCHECLITINDSSNA